MGTWFIASWTGRLGIIQTSIAAYGIHTSTSLTLMLFQVTLINVCQTETFLTISNFKLKNRLYTQKGCNDNIKNTGIDIMHSHL
jgi:hypothetical protein